jgi:hypothetical protein
VSPSSAADEAVAARRSLSLRLGRPDLGLARLFFTTLKLYLMEHDDILHGGGSKGEVGCGAA